MTQNSIQKLSKTTLEIKNEDHTILNPLRFIINLKNTVEMVGYTIPHPSEKRGLIKIQNKTGQNLSVDEVVAQGLDDLDIVCDKLLSFLEFNINQ